MNTRAQRKSRESVLQGTESMKLHQAGRCSRNWINFWIPDSAKQLAASENSLSTELLLLTISYVENSRQLLTRGVMCLDIPVFAVWSPINILEWNVTIVKLFTSKNQQTSPRDANLLNIFFGKFNPRMQRLCLFEQI